MALSPGGDKDVETTGTGGDGGTPDWLRLDNAAKIYPPRSRVPPPASGSASP